MIWINNYFFCFMKKDFFWVLTETSLLFRSFDCFSVSFFALFSDLSNFDFEDFDDFIAELLLSISECKVVPVLEDFVLFSLLFLSKYIAISAMIATNKTVIPIIIIIFSFESIEGLSVVVVFGSEVEDRKQSIAYFLWFFGLHWKI